MTIWQRTVALPMYLMQVMVIASESTLKTPLERKKCNYGFELIFKLDRLLNAWVRGSLQWLSW